MNKNSNVPEIRFKGFDAEWEQRKVSEVADIIAGGTPSTSINSYWEPKEIPWLSSGEVHKKYISYTDNKISAEGMNHSSARMVKENSVLIALAGQGKTRGTVAINRIPLTTNQSIAAMTFTEEIVPEFVFCNLDSRYDEIRKMSSGDGARGGLNKQIVGDIIIPYTSKPEQERIGSFFKSIDNLITLHQRKVERLKNAKKAMLTKLFPKEGERMPEVRFKGFTGDWEQRKLGDVFEERHIVSVLSKEYPRLSFTIEEGVISPEDRKTNKRDFLIKDEENKRYLVTELNDVIYNPANVVYGAIHRNSYGKGCISPIYKIFKTSEDSIFMGYVVRRDQFILELSRLTEGTVTKLKTLKPEDFLTKEVIIPSSLSEQTSIGNLLANIDNLITLHQRKYEKLIDCKKAFLNKMFGGES